MVGIMFVAIIGCAVATGFSVAEPLQWPKLPRESLTLTLALAGGVGGSVTMLVYGYWIKEREWDTSEHLPLVRMDLAVAYGVTGFLALGAMFLASQTLLPQGSKVEGAQGLITMASMLKVKIGSMGEWIFLIGFWGATFSSLLGVLQGVPYLFADLIACWTKQSDANEKSVFDYSAANKTIPYKLYLVFLAIPSTLFLFFDRPIYLMLFYAAISSLFLPVLASALLLMNNRWVAPKYRNGWMANTTLIMALVLFVGIAVQGIVQGVLNR